MMCKVEGLMRILAVVGYGVLDLRSSGSYILRHALSQPCGD
jgi:hypothetical protein